MMRRRGLSLIEVLIAIVLLGIVGIGITRLLQSQMRFFSRSTNARDARAVTRNALNIVRSEMRMIEPRGVVAATADSITVYVPYAMGLHCSLSTATFIPVDSLLYATASYAGYAWRDTASTATYAYVTGASAPSNGLATSCTLAGMAAVPNGRTLVLSPAVPTTTVGAPVFLFQQVTYKFANSTLVPGRRALWRIVRNGASEEIAVPFDAGSRFRFFATDSLHAQDAVPSPLNTLRGVELVLVGESERASPGVGAPEESNMRLPILFRNAVQ